MPNISKQSLADGGLKDVLTLVRGIRDHAKASLLINAATTLYIR